MKLRIYLTLENAIKLMLKYYLIDKMTNINELYKNLEYQIREFQICFEILLFFREESA